MAEEEDIDETSKKTEEEGADEDAGPPSYRMQRPKISRPPAKEVSTKTKTIMYIVAAILIISILLEIFTRGGPFTAISSYMGELTKIDCRDEANRTSVFCARSRDNLRSGWSTGSDNSDPTRGSSPFTLYGR
jgi:hypothetical protein